MLIVCTIFFWGVSNAQSSRKTSIKRVRHYAFVLSAGGGLARYLAEINTQGKRKDVIRTFTDGTLRLMWYPNHRLRVGIETGYSNFYNYTIIDSANITGRVKLIAIPILVVWSMPITKRVNIFAGIGSYYLTTKLNYKIEVKSNTISLGSIVALNYLHPISNSLGIATELKWKNAFQTKDAQLALQIQVIWKFLNY